MVFGFEHQERRKQKRELREAADADEEVGFAQVTFPKKRHGLRRVVAAIWICPTHFLAWLRRVQTRCEVLFRYLAVVFFWVM